MKLPPFFLIVAFLIAACSEDPEPNTVCNVTIEDDYIAIEAEATDSELGDWEIVRSGDERYRDEDAVLPINGTHLEYAGNNSYNEPVSPLRYMFVAPKTATYQLAMRLYQRLDGEAEDKCNDVFVRMEGDFTAGSNAYTTEDLKSDYKFLGRGVDEWGCAYTAEIGDHTFATLQYNFTEGEEYTLVMSGRSERTNIDYILLFNTELDITTKAHNDLAEVNDEKYRPDWVCADAE